MDSDESNQTPKWTYVNPDGVTSSIVFEYRSPRLLHANLEDRYRAEIRNKEHTGGIDSTVRLFDGTTPTGWDPPELMAHLTFHHKETTPEKITDEICEFVAGMLWSRLRRTQYADAYAVAGVITPEA